MEEERNCGAKTFLQIFPISSSPFHFFHSSPFFRQPPNPNFHSNGFCEIHKSFVSNVQKYFLKFVDNNNIRSQNEILDKLLSFPAHLHSFFQIQIPIPIPIPRSKCRNLSSPNFAAILPGDAVGGLVVAGGISSFLNIYNTLLIVRLVLTWFPSAPPAVVTPLSTLCDPYLNIFRGIIPPLGGLDLSPILAFLVLNAFTSTAAAIPAELPPTPTSSRPTTSQEKWITRLARGTPKGSNADQM